MRLARRGHGERAALQRRALRDSPAMLAHSPPSTLDALKRHETARSFPGLERVRSRRHRRRVGLVHRHAAVTLAVRVARAATSRLSRAEEPLSGRFTSRLAMCRRLSRPVARAIDRAHCPSPISGKSYTHPETVGDDLQGQRRGTSRPAQTCSRSPRHDIHFPYEEQKCRHTISPTSPRRKICAVVRSLPDEADSNLDPITGEPGAHPVGTGLGASRRCAGRCGDRRRRRSDRDDRRRARRRRDRRPGRQGGRGEGRSHVRWQTGAASGRHRHRRKRRRAGRRCDRRRRSRDRSDWPREQPSARPPEPSRVKAPRKSSIPNRPTSSKITTSRPAPARRPARWPAQRSERLAGPWEWPRARPWAR